MDRACPRRPGRAELRHLPRPLPAHRRRLEIHGTRLRGPLRGHFPAGRLAAPPRLRLKGVAGGGAVAGRAPAADQWQEHLVDDLGECGIRYDGGAPGHVFVAQQRCRACAPPSRTSPPARTPFPTRRQPPCGRGSGAGSVTPRCRSRGSAGRRSTSWPPTRSSATHRTAAFPALAESRRSRALSAQRCPGPGVPGSGRDPGREIRVGTPGGGAAPRDCAPDSAPVGMRTLIAGTGGGSNQYDPVRQGDTL